jgi:SAM-dependent methyltransferase
MSPIADSVPTTPLPEHYDREDGTNACFVCEQPDYRPLYETRHFGFPVDFQRCRCGLIKQTPMPNEKFFEWFFNSEVFFSARQEKLNTIWGYYDYFADESSRMETSKRRYRKLSHLFDVRYPLEMMKIGPSTGTFLHVANQHGHHARGCDISSRFAKYAEEHYQVKIEIGRFERKDYADGEFDVILLFNVIENVPNPVEFLSAIRRTLKEGGYFVFNHVDMGANLVASFQKDRYFIFRPPTCYAYEANVIGRILEKFNFDMKENIRDIRHMHMEKIITLLGWRWPLALLRPLELHQIPFPVYAYPSRIVVAQRGS